MLLCIDIGNSSLSVGLFDGAAARPEPLYTAKLSSDTRRTADEYAITLRGLLADRVGAIDAAVIGSVVPQLTHTIEAAVRAVCGEALAILHIGGGVRTGISLRVDDPAALGADIVTAAAAAVALHGAPVIFFDFGTATVCGAVNPARELCGVTIAPGLSTSLAGLRDAAARIPYIELSTPATTLGKNTPDAVRAGVVIGAACMADGMIDRIRAEWHRAEWRIPTGADIPVVVTGGLSPLVLPALSHPVIPDPHLTLRGLALIHRATVAREQKRR